MVDVQEELRDRLASRAVTVIVGAGVSIQASGGAPCASWQGLLLDGANEARSDPDFRERYPVVERELHSNHPEDLISAARKISRTLGAPNGGRYRSWLRRAVGQFSLVDRSILDAIHSLGARIATTNYDDLLSRTRDGMPPVCWTEPSRVERVIRGDEAGVLHLHGYWERPESVILDASSYDQILGDEHAQSVLRTLRMTSTLVFVGCGAGLQDPNFDQFRAWLARTMRSSEYPSYRLSLDGEVDALQRMHRDAKDGVQVIGYGAKHDDLKPYLCGLAAAPRPNTAAADEAATMRARRRFDLQAVGTPAPALSSLPAPPVPFYVDAEVKALSHRLKDAQARRDKLRSAGIAVDAVDHEILGLRRQLREGGQLRAGDSLGDGRYLLVKIVGRGGFAIVWEAYDHAAQQRVAIKVLHSNLAGDPLRRERFFRGAQAMMRLAHSRVVRVLEPRGEDGGFYYFVMEFVPGANLRETVLGKRVGSEVLLALILQIGEALTLAHARGMVHRDIKPSNIVLDEGNNAKLTDFDLVGAHDTTGGTRTGALGTVVYAAPECLDKPQDATARADVYGLGMTAIFCLLGRELSLATFRNPEPTIAGLDCSAQVRQVLRRAVAWEPDARFADAGAMVAELRSAPELRDIIRNHYRASLDADPNDLHAHAAIADLAWEQGNWQEAADSLMACVRLEISPEVLKTLCFRIGVLYADRLGDVATALKAFQRALTYQPDDENTLIWIADLAIRVGEWKLALGACERLVQNESDPDRRAAHLHRVAKIFKHGFGDNKRAERALRLALDDAPTNDEALSQLVQFYRDANDLTSVRVHLNRVAGAMRARVAADPQDGVAYRVISRAMSARAAANVTGSLPIARAAAELAELLGTSGDPEQRLLQASRQPDPSLLAQSEADDVLFPRGVPSELRQIFQLLGDRIVKHVGIDLRPYGVTRGDRLYGRDNPVAAVAQAVASGLGFGEIDVYVSDRQPWVMVAEPTSPVSLVIGTSIANDGGDAIRFAAGYALKLAQAQLAIAARLPIDDLGVLVVALLRLFQSDFYQIDDVDAVAVAAQVQKLRRLIPTGLMNELKPFALAIDLQRFRHTSLSRDLKISGLRAGLVASGSLRAGLRILSSQIGGELPSFLADPLAQGLVRFALGEDYALVAR